MLLWNDLREGFDNVNRYKTHYNDVIMSMIASQITSLTIVYSTVYSDADQRKHQSSASLAFVWGIHRGIGDFPAQMASNAENVSIWWRHHEFLQWKIWPCTVLPGNTTVIEAITLVTCFNLHLSGMLFLRIASAKMCLYFDNSRTLRIIQDYLVFNTMPVDDRPSLGSMESLTDRD